MSMLENHLVHRLISMHFYAVRAGGFFAQYANKYPLSNKIRKTSRCLHVWDDRYW